LEGSEQNMDQCLIDILIIIRGGDGGGGGGGGL